MGFVGTWPVSPLNIAALRSYLYTGREYGAPKYQLVSPLVCMVQCLQHGVTIHLTIQTS